MSVTSGSVTNVSGMKEIVRLRYIRIQKDALSSASDKQFTSFMISKLPKIIGKRDDANLHLHNLVYVQEFCSRCVDEESEGDFVLCGRRIHSFWQDTVGDVF